MRYLPPIPLKEKYWIDIERRIERALWEGVFKPLYEVFKESGVEIKNDVGDSPLIAAIKSGRITFNGLGLSGSFNAATTKEMKKLGGVYKRAGKSWVFDSMPSEVQSAIAFASAKSEKTLGRLVSTLDSLDVDSAITKAGIKEGYGHSVDKMNNDFLKMSEKITVAPMLTAQAVDTITKEWAENLELYVRNFAEDQILEMRKTITDNTMAGYRAEGVAKKIQKEYGVSKRKAKFLARQETALLTSKFQKERFKDIGVTRYRWSTSGDERVRGDHKELNGKIFSWDSPPVTDRRTGKRNHPSEDFGCRCIAIPVLD